MIYYNRDSWKVKIDVDKKHIDLLTTAEIDTFALQELIYSIPSVVIIYDFPTFIGTYLSARIYGDNLFTVAEEIVKIVKEEMNEVVVVSS